MVGQSPSRSSFSSNACLQYALRLIMRLRAMLATASTSSWGNLNCICSSQNFALMEAFLPGLLRLSRQIISVAPRCAA